MKIKKCLLLIIIITLAGCDREESMNGNKNNQIIQQAIKVFDKENGSDRHKEYVISLEEDSDEWTVFFTHKVPKPGDHALVWINKHTKKAKYMPGE